MLPKYYSEDTFLIRDIIEDPKKFSRLIDSYGDSLYYYILRVLVFDKVQTNQIVQQIFVDTYAQARYYDSSISLKCWLYQKAYLALKDTIQKGKRNFSSTGTNISSRLNQSDIDDLNSDDFDLLMSHLSPLDRHILILQQIQQFSENEIAVIMKISPGESLKLTEQMNRNIKQLLVYG